MTSFAHSVMRVAVWNLAGNDLFPGGAGTGIVAGSRKAFAQAHGLSLMDPDFATLVEVFPQSHIQWLADTLAERGLGYDVTMLPQPDSHLNIGFLHKPGITVENPRFIAGSQGTYTGGRRAFAVDVRAGARFKAVIIGVHLKSGREALDQKLRDSQCKVIGDWITRLHDTPGYKQHAIVLMGDFNMIPGRDVSNFHHLGGDDVMDFVSSWDLQERFSHILESGRANLLDGFAVSRRFSTRYIRGSLKLFPMNWAMGEDGIGREKFRREVSDHLPFTASFRLF
ncbi:exonuclease/endonuclease/phosphatase family protein [Anianabacter salinae]|uniref:GMP synthase n=1 Tax=Anianabacter salinae TaxID=2851023 RepID=UPI00225E18CB|nr:GMP synthase [Anianabacter salinae]MBV0912195.1 GMP synthase [Anianabacter salinae]